MRARPILIAAVVVIASMGSGVAAAAGPDTNPPGGTASSGSRFGVLAIGPATLPGGLAAELEAAAATGLAASGGEVVARALTARPAGSCDAPACLQEVARSSGARYLLRGTCEIEGSTYRVHLELVDSVSGTTAAARQDTCEICTEHDVIEATNIAASALKATLDRAAPPAGSVGHPAAGAVLSTGDATGSGRAPRPVWLRVAPWVAFAVAAGALGAGAYILSLNGKETSCNLKDENNINRCTELYATGWQGGPLIGAGVVAGLLGVLALTWTPSSDSSGTPPAAGHAAAGRPIRPTGVSLSPAGIAAWTTF